jgi:aspartyl-tRNA(Asn)/glutamyl-tRNA(Gln) amidotransferase subunit B
LNKEAVYLAVKGALVLGCGINLQSSFDRKHYFYKDLPSGYQITQQYRTLKTHLQLTAEPLAVNGSVPVNPADDKTGALKSPFILAISRVQLEQDTAKTTSIPINGTPNSTALLTQSPLTKFLLDHNRASIPLIEIITPPILHSAAAAATAFAKVAEILRATGVTTGDLHWGAMRCDVNVSLGLRSPRTEIKNLFSVSAVRDAARAEIDELVQKFENDVPIEACTKAWDGDHVRFLRAKKGEEDYRYRHREMGVDGVGIYRMRIYLRCDYRGNLLSRRGRRYRLSQSTF